ncbi:hypothetical protein [Alkalibaculum bacchi]|nr:hypothetical protein [Alkalibaculum bacchi]
MKKNLSLLLFIILTLSISACKDDSTYKNQKDLNQSSQEQTENTAVLCADFSSGNSDLNIKEYELEYTGDLTPEALLEGLTELTGLDFIADTAQTQKGITVDWKKESTLIANLGDREQKEEFFFYDADSMRWFMMDSLYRTLRENFEEIDTYYTMDGGKELEFEELYPVKLFPTDMSYEGSPFYFAHASSQSDEE